MFVPTLHKHTFSTHPVTFVSPHSKAVCLGKTPSPDTPLCLLLPVAHLSAGAHWGKGIGATHEHLPAGNNQDSHIVLTLLLRQEGKQ